MSGKESIYSACFKRELSGSPAPFQLKELIMSKLREKTSDQMVAQNHQTVTVGNQLSQEILEKYCTAAACPNSGSLDLQPGIKTLLRLLQMTIAVLPSCKRTDRVRGQ